MGKANHNKSFHPAAEIFPLLEGREFDELVESIKKNGQQVPIYLLNDEIIDGRNRYLACLEAKEEPWFATADLDGMEPIEYVLVLNQHRRHLSDSQRAMVAARVKEYHAAQAKERQRLSDGRGKKGPVTLPDLKGDARDKAGEALQVSGKSVDHAAKVIKEGTKELQTAVDSGQASVSAAAKVAELPEQEQRKVIETAAQHPRGMRKGIAEAAKKLSEEKPSNPKVYRADAPMPRGQSDDQWNVVPDDLLEVFESRDEFHKLHRDIVSLAGRVQSLAGKPEGYYLPHDLHERLQAIASDVSDATPSVLCDEEPGWRPKGGAS